MNFQAYFCMLMMNCRTRLYQRRTGLPRNQPCIDISVSKHLDHWKDTGAKWLSTRKLSRKSPRRVSSAAVMHRNKDSPEASERIWRSSFLGCCLKHRVLNILWKCVIASIAAGGNQTIISRTVEKQVSCQLESHHILVPAPLPCPWICLRY